MLVTIVIEVAVGGIPSSVGSVLGKMRLCEGVGGLRVLRSADLHILHVCGPNIAKYL